MKRILKAALTFLIVFGMAASIAPIPAQATLANRDDYYVAVLKPERMPRVKESYPARLKMSLASPYLSANVEFAGSVGVNAALTDEELLEMLKAALPVVDGYRELQDPVDDKVLVRQLTEKLQFTGEDMQEIVENWKKMLGVDELSDLLSGKFPGFDAADGATAALDLAETIIGVAGDYTYTHDVSLKPSLPGGAGTVINGIFISYEEYQKDVERYEDIVRLSKTKERLRVYYSAVNEQIRDRMAEKGDWRLVINSQDVADFTFMEMPGNKQLWTAEIDLVKSMDGLTSIEGTYSGTFKLGMEADMSAFDNGYAAYWAGRTSTAQTSYSVTTNEGQRSVMKLDFEIPDCQLGISLPSGTLRHFFEEEIPSSELMQSHFSVNVDRTFSMRADLPQGSYTTSDQHITQLNGEFMRSETSTTFINSPGAAPSVVQSDSPSRMEWPPDLRGSVTMTLIIDMLGK